MAQSKNGAGQTIEFTAVDYPSGGVGIGWGSPDANRGSALVVQLVQLCSTGGIYRPFWRTI